MSSHPIAMPMNYTKCVYFVEIVCAWTRPKKQVPIPQKHRGFRVSRRNIVW